MAAALVPGAESAHGRSDVRERRRVRGGLLAQGACEGVNGKALLKHYESAIDAAIEYVEEQQGNAEESSDMKAYAKATRVLGKLERAKEIASLVGDDADFRDAPPQSTRARESSPRRDDPEEAPQQDGVPVSQVEPRAEDYLPGPGGSPPRLGTGMRRLGRK